MSKVNPIYRSLLDKSVSSLLSAIEIYNKPNFQYREETFAILAVNAWELLFKAYILSLNKFKVRSIYQLQPKENKDGSLSKKIKVVKRNRCGNEMSISIFDAISFLDHEKKLNKDIIDNIEVLIELRDNSIHFYNADSIVKPIQELGFACVKNYISIVKQWDVPIDLSQYNLYLMPLAYVDSKKIVAGCLTDKEKRYVDFFKAKVDKSTNTDEDYGIAISIDVDFKKGHSLESIGVHYDPDGAMVKVSEESIREKYPFDYSEVVKRCKNRYTDFKRDKKFNGLMRTIKTNEKLCHPRLLDPDKPKGAKKDFYSSNILKELDKYYTKK